jgi:hypothetical protein
VCSVSLLRATTASDSFSPKDKRPIFLPSYALIAVQACAQIRQQPNAMYLEFDLGADANAYRQLSDLLVSLGATPKSQIMLPNTAAEMPRHLIVIPIKVKNELADYGLRLSVCWRN